MISAKTQIQNFTVDLTVAEIHVFTKRGALDFGGSEFIPVSSKAIKAKLLSAEDKYGWWELHQGMYLVRYNERLESQNFSTGILSPHPRLIAAGAGHHSITVSPGNTLQSVLLIPQVGCALKQNCRVSQLQLFRA